MTREEKERDAEGTKEVGKEMGNRVGRERKWK